MSGTRFDVVVTGAVDASPDGQRRLTTALAARLHLPIPGVARGLAEQRFVAGRELEQAAAQSLQRELEKMGAAVAVRPALAGPPSVVLSAPPSLIGPGPAGPPSMVSGPPPLTVGPSAASSFSLPAGAPVNRDPFTPAPSATGLEPAPSSAPRSGARLDPAPGSGPRSGARLDPAPPSGPKRDPFAPPPGSEPKLDLARPVPRPPARPAAPDRLELDLGPQGSSEELARLKQMHGASLHGAASGIDVRGVATSSDSGLAVDDKAADEAYRVRCAKHGLFYDTRKASGCRKCLERGRVMEEAVQAQRAPFKLHDFGGDDRKRAFVGLAVALLLGLLPASYHALGVGARELRRLRAEQEILSRKPATEETLRRFEELDEGVRKGKSRSTRTTFIIWLVFSGGAMAAWYRLT